jgi:hypothetical protein
MDPHIKQVLDELKTLKSSVDLRITGVEEKLDSKFKAMEEVAVVFDDWKPKVDASMKDLKVEVGALCKTVNRVVLESNPSSSTGIFGKPRSAAATSSAGNSVDGSNEHDTSFRNREDVLGKVFTHMHLPRYGYVHTPPKQFPKSSSHPVFPASFPSDDDYAKVHSSRSPTFHNGSGRIPKLNFPEFDENPQLWIRRSEDYIELCQVEPSKWIKISVMYFTKSAARWLQSVEPRLRTMSWAEFCRLVLDHFGKEHHELLIRQLFHIKQLTNVAEYIERFSELVDQLTTYESKTDPLYYSMHFVDGLKHDIK